MKKIMILIFVISMILSQNSSTLSGFVKDAANKESLIGVNIYFSDIKLGTVTNTDGYFVLTDIPTGEYKLIIHYVGYQLIEETLNFGTNVDLKKNVFLKEDLITSDIIEVVAEKQKKKIDLLFESRISEIQINNKTMQQIPQVAESDLLRTLQTKPGVVSVSDFSSALYIRGGNSDQNLYLIDGAEIYNPEHAFGIFSTFNTDAIKIAELSKGGFSAEYGGRLSSVLNVINLDGNREKFEGTASISLLAAKTTLQFPINQNGSISASIRRTYFDQLIGNSMEELPNYYFWDGNIKAFYEINEQNNISLSFFSGRDDFELLFNKKAVLESNDNKEGIHYDWGNNTASLKWTNIISPRLFSNTWFNYSTYDSKLTQYNSDFYEDNTIEDFTIKSSLNFDYSRYVYFKFGFEYKQLTGKFIQEDADYYLNIPFDKSLYMLYSTFVWKSESKWDVELGLRVNKFKQESRSFDLSPRFSAKYKLNETMNLKFSAGKYYQYLHQAPRQFIANVWVIANEFQKPSSSSHFILGYQQSIEDGQYDLEIEIYSKKYWNIYNFNRFANQAIPDKYRPDGTPVYLTTNTLFHEGSGDSKGFELTFTKNKGYFSGWLAYTFSATKVNFESLNFNQSFYPRHDRTHLINAVLNINYSQWLAGESWDNKDSELTFGLNFIYGSGQATAVPSSLYFRNINPGESTVQWHSVHPSSLDEFRMPAYIRLDLSINYLMKYETMTVKPYVQIFNLGNRNNIWYMNYNTKVQNGKVIPEIELNSMIPLLPTIGVNFTF
jgi:outer membrane cobalamin receptor